MDTQKRVPVESDTSRPPATQEEAFARIDAAFELLYSPDGSDAELIRRSNGKIVTPPLSDRQTIRVDPGFTASYYRIKLALHLGRMPLAQVDHADGDRRNNSLANLREADAKENNRNKGPRKRADQALPRGVYQTKGGRFAVQLQDEDGRKRRHGKYNSLTEATAIAREYRRKRDGKFYKATPPGHRNRKSSRSA